MANDIITLFRNRPQWEYEDRGDSFVLTHKISGKTVRTSKTPQDLNAVHQIERDIERVEKEFAHMFAGAANVTKNDNKVSLYFKPIESRKLVAAAGMEWPTKKETEVRFNYNFTPGKGTITLTPDGSKKFNINETSEGPTLWAQFGAPWPGSAKYEPAPYTIEGNKIKILFPRWKVEEKMGKPTVTVAPLKGETFFPGDREEADLARKAEAQSRAEQATFHLKSNPSIEDLKVAVQMVNEYAKSLRDSGHHVRFSFAEDGTLHGSVSITVKEEF